VFIFGNYYSVSELAKTLYATVVTKVFYRGCLLIRRPVVIRGKPRIVFGDGFTTGYNCRLETLGARKDRTKKLVFGRNCKIGDGVHMVAADRVIFGDNCLLASNVFISDCSHGRYSGEGEQDVPSSTPNDRPLVTAPVEIGDNVWLGENVCVLMGVHIGNGAIVGANSVVTGDVPENCIAAGAPAIVLKQFDAESRRWERRSVRASDGNAKNDGALQ